MKAFRIIAILFYVCCASACSKDEPVISITSQIKEIIRDYDVKRVIPAATYSEYFNLAYDSGGLYGNLFNIEGDFITVGLESWNLNQLVKYRIDNINSVSVLGLFF